MLEAANVTQEMVDQVIETLPLSLPIDWENPFWAIMMGIEHSRIHLETSSVIIRRLPLDQITVNLYEKDLSSVRVVAGADTAGGRRLARAGIGGCYTGARKLAQGRIVSRTHFAHYLVAQGHAACVETRIKVGSLPVNRSPVGRYLREGPERSSR